MEDLPQCSGLQAHEKGQPAARMTRASATQGPIRGAQAAVRLPAVHLHPAAPLLGGHRPGGVVLPAAGPGGGRAGGGAACAQPRPGLAPRRWLEGSAVRRRPPRGPQGAGGQRHRRPGHVAGLVSCRQGAGGWRLRVWLGGGVGPRGLHAAQCPTAAAGELPRPLGSMGQPGKLPAGARLLPLPTKPQGAVAGPLQRAAAGRLGGAAGRVQLPGAVPGQGLQVRARTAPCCCLGQPPAGSPIKAQRLLAPMLFSATAAACTPPRASGGNDLRLHRTPTIPSAECLRALPAHH
jgi:hypothetical protein